MFKINLIAFASVIYAFTNASGSDPIDYSENGENWGEHYPLCKYGKEQTPIDLQTKGVSSSANMQLNGYAYQNMASTTITRSANTIVLNLNAGEFQIDFADGSKSLFQPLQFHFHSPSEHTVDGYSYDLEMHIVHYYKDQPTSLGAVVGIFFDREKGGNYSNPFLDSLNFGKTVVDTAIPVTNVNLASLLSGTDFSRYWSYKGSLTTPPCTEGIKWSVIEQVQPISDAQLTAFQQYFSGNTSYAKGKGNNRESQPLNLRTLYFQGANYLMATSVAITALFMLYF